VKRSSYLTWADLRVVALTVVSLVLFALGTWFVGSRVGLFTTKYRLYTFMETVSGLQTGAPVRLAGVNVGTVEAIDFIEPGEADSLDALYRRLYADSLGGRNLRVRLAVDTDVRERITRSSTAKIGTIGLLGDKYVSVDVGEPEDAALAEGDVLRNELPLDYEALIARGAAAVDELVLSIENAQQIVAKVNAGEGTLGRLVNDDELYRDFVELSTRGAATMARLESGEGALGRLLNDPTLYREMVETSRELQALADRVAAGEGTLGSLVQDPTLYRRMIEVVDRTDAVLDQVESGEGTAGKLLTDEDLYEQLQRFVTDTQNLVNDIRENPRKYLNLTIF
jgi:phospholipid/cholesterol/gamma-HCH transport system substrate-binding protein